MTHVYSLKNPGMDTMIIKDQKYKLHYMKYEETF